MPGILIAGTHSGCGKTTVSIGLLAALKKRGLRVQAFKTGPDFIDSGLHRMITGRPSRNLDLWMCGEDYVRECYFRNTADVDVAVVEGVMGLYDGTLSTASLAARLKLPVVLVIDSYGMAETAGALVRGIDGYASERGIELKGVIFNRVASQEHFQRLCAGIRGMKVLGYLPRELEFEIPHRHLGLTVAEETPIARENIKKLADAVLNCIDIDGVMKIGRAMRQCHVVTGLQNPRLPCSPVVAVAYDRAFCFYYEDNFDLLRNAGAEIIRFSPLDDVAVPEKADVIYIGGGYPELYAGALSGNRPMLKSIKNWAGAGRPLYAECGGLMYLSKGIHDFEGNFFAMADVFPFEPWMKRGRSKLGYREVILKEDCIIGKRGERLRGHEFHYSEIAEETGNDPAIAKTYTLRNSGGQELHSEGYRYRNALVSYVHIHFGSNPGSAGELVNSYKEGR